MSHLETLCIFTWEVPTKKGEIPYGSLRLYFLMSVLVSATLYFLDQLICSNPLQESTS